ncbi:MAG: DUF7088 domain-containing protein, partial [Bryobacteraceae bacterium]
MAEPVVTPPEIPVKRLKKKSTLAARQARYGATATLYTVVVLAVLAAINWLGYRYDRTVDTTSNKRFTLSQETKKVVGDLKQNATIVYFDKSSNFEQAKGILDRYKELSPKIKIEYVDYQKQPTLARAYGLQDAGTAYV